MGARSGTLRRFTFVTGFSPLYLPASSAALNALCRKPRKLFRLLGLSSSCWLQMPSVRRRGKTRYMIDLLRFVSGLAADLVRRHGELVAEIALLRQQLIVAQRKIAGRVRWAPWQRFTIALAARVAPAWREATLLVQPGDHPPLASGRVPRPLAAVLSALGTTAHLARGIDPRDGDAQSALGRRAHPRRVAQARRPRLQADRPTVHPPFPAPKRRPSLVNVRSQPRHAGVRIRPDVRHPVPRSLRALLPRPPPPKDHPCRGHVWADRRMVRAAGQERHHGRRARCARLRPRHEAQCSLR